MDVPTFQNTFPAFRETDPQFILATLNRAARWHDACAWGDLMDDGIALLAAHWLWIDPLGAATGLPEKEGVTSVYGTQWLAMKRAVSAGPWPGF